ncbi:glycosyl transferase family 1 [Brevundimonas sp. LM2]|uniref:glycosyltransferase n=1 Tax=Brevundimonas sp. LM2 TaxID=1938605 RepID=UPI0009839226|nr:glycosyltransferase [Brevundimonas sp. LM2]AQR62858.1 glycosyl transferase family 1 [Brevundimonas sp. LM2]
MRIGVIAHLKYPIHEPFAGGLEMHTHLLASALKRRGHQVTVFASTLSEPGIGLEAICDETALSAVGVGEARDVAFFREHHAYLSLMNDLRHRDFDVIHNNSLHYLPVAMADALPMPMVTTLHTPPFSWLESGVRVARGRNNSFVGVSRSIRSAWSSVTTVDEVILNGIDLSRFAFAPRSAADPYLVWYGRIVPEKGLHFALDAARLVGLPIRFAGPLLDRAYWDREIAPRLTSETVYLGHLDHGALAGVIGGARAALCTPCWEEPYGLVVAEALACGVPVAAFARGAIPEILTDACGVLAAPDDAASLAVATRQALTLSRSACRHRAETLCDAEVMIDQYLAHYRARLQVPAPARMDARFAVVPDPLPPLIRSGPRRAAEPGPQRSGTGFHAGLPTPDGAGGEAQP